MKSTHHIIDKIPHLEPEGMYVEYEFLANELVNSGLLRVDTGDKCNFARWVDAGKNISLMLSKEELDGELLAKTKKKLSKHYTSPQRIQSVIDNCNAQLRKMQPVSHEIRIKLARLLIQSTHPIVFRWILLEQVEIFVSYSNSIGDLMDIMTWKHSGANSGMQSTDGRDVAVFVSSGGDPFAPTDPERRMYGDGWPAIARIQIIAAQELGHYADIRRDMSGRQIGRHSTNFSCTIPDPKAKVSRMGDINICREMRAILMKNGLGELLRYESALKFYRKNKIGGPRAAWQKIMIAVYKTKLLKLAKDKKFLFLRKFSDEQYMGIMIDVMISDMEENLTPKADVYKRDNKDAEIAIACAEALARVPQQANKWGHITTSTMMRNLYKIYYEEVIPDLIGVYNHLMREHYNPDLSRIEAPLMQKIKSALFKTKDLPYREVE